MWGYGATTVRCSFITDYVHAVLLYRLKMTAVSTTERLHERSFDCAAAVSKNDCMSAAEATLGAAGTLQESYCKIATGSFMVH